MTKPGFPEFGFLTCLLLNIVNFHFFAGTVFGIVCSEAGSFLKCAVRQFIAAGFYDNMGAGNTLGMEPPVAAVGKFKGQLFILKIVFSDINVIPIGGNVMERLTCQLLLFCVFFAV